ncbi:tRNA 2-thiocytidine(32) synthetase TtcA [Vagococcus penaei]|uniref:tRNA 2-thiocytidine(32) synthetase TtcA n=1 Tax=Vagococcus penaei TaxID=633807 RepID=A0A1Q2D7J1_9ENTE|nr:ATP-binding protein [Vagococcus penaei]AQP54358.1 tRNA 2-thiocytidine(32) synthetase TtcA [Vagococcus penaei]RSU06274.1 tRNA 2-thiocytidine(32) synthetase TtcA [Vagococcus penaei]
MSFKSKENQIYYNPVRRAILNYEMIQPNEKVAVGLSGGKDSTTLLTLLDTISKQKRLGYSFEIIPIALDLGFDMELAPLSRYVESLGYHLEIVPTKIATVVFDIREESNPCSLCAKMRRGILYTKASELGCTKVALGHHLDDAVETFFMNFFFHGLLESFQPITYLTQTQISIIRPLLYIEEQDIRRFVQEKELPVIFNPCPVDKKTKREEMKQLVSRLSQEYPLLKKRFIQSMETNTIDTKWHR